MSRALIVEDDTTARFALSELIEKRGFATETAATFAEARVELQRGTFDVVLLDVVLPDGSGFDLLLEVPADRRPQIILMSGEDEVQRAVADLGLQRVSFLRKPVDLSALSSLLAGLRKRRRPVASGEIVRTGRFVGRSAALAEVQELIGKVAPTEFPVLIEGESGTGKELVAEAIHLASPRSRRPMVALNCGALPSGLIDSELFGHERGAFTGATSAQAGVFEQASGGTLFLDELGEMAPDVQVRLLRVLETGRLKRVGGRREVEVDVRVVAATNRRVQDAVAAGVLREDLVHRLSVFPIRLPPLRERRDDVLDLARFFLAEVVEQEGAEKTLSPATLDVLRAYHWPGNVRQLRNAIQRAYLIAEGEITPDCLARHIVERSGGVHRPAARSSPEAAPHASDDVTIPIGSTIAEAERSLIEATLEEHHGDKRAAAETLGISLRTLYNRLRDYEAGDRPSD